MWRVSSLGGCAVLWIDTPARVGVAEGLDRGYVGSTRYILSVLGCPCFDYFAHDWIKKRQMMVRTRYNKGFWHPWNFVFAGHGSDSFQV